MNNESLLLISLGVFAALIVAVVAITQTEIDQHPITEPAGLIWRVGDEFDRIQDLEVTLQVTDESRPGEYVKFKIKYVNNPTPVFSMRYVPPEDVSKDVFMSSVGNETFSVKNDQLAHYIPSENVSVSKRWPGMSLVNIGLGFFNLSQVQADWDAGTTEVRILHDPGFSEIPSAMLLSLGIESFTDTSNPFDRIPGLEPQGPESYALCFSFCPNLQVEDATSSLGFSQSLFEYSGGTLQNSHILEIRDAQSEDLLRMIWIDPVTLLVQKIITFRNGERSTTFLVQSITIDQGLTESDVITPLPDAVPNIRG